MAKITIVGTGLIGTSLALALKESQVRDLRLVGTDFDGEARSGAQKRGAFQKVERRLSPAVSDADIIILATPVMAMRELMEAMGPHLPEGCVVTDVGSSKKVVMEWADQYLPRGVDFVGGHPMAGKETSGPEAADAGLFRGKAYCIIPSPHASKDAVAEVTSLAEVVGALPYFIGVDEHDSFVAAASHLPFLLSVALVGCTSKSENWEDIAQLASSGYRDISRLASGDPTMHRDICVSNPGPIVAWIDAFIREMYEVRQLLDGGETPREEDLHQAFVRASAARAAWLAGKVSPSNREPGRVTEIPGFAQNMGEMFLGRRIMDAQRRFTRDWRDGGRERK